MHLRAWFLSAAFVGLLTACPPAQASILWFDIFDPAYSFTEDYPEGFGIDQTYGDNVTSTSVTSGTTTFAYGVGAEGFTPNVQAAYGPFSLFTGGPTLWRYGYGDLVRNLYQGSEGDVGTDYDFLDIVLFADPNFDVVLHSFDLAGFPLTDHTIDSVTVYDGVPFPFLTPTNQIYEEFDVFVAGTGPSHTHIDFGGVPLTSHVIWLRIDATNLGDVSDDVGIDNIVFGQVASANDEFIDPSEIDAALAPVPEPVSLVIWLVGAGAGLVVHRRRRMQG